MSLERTVVDYTVDENVAVLTMVHEPYNLLGPTLLEPLLDALDRAVEEQRRAAVIRSGLRHFCAGADISMFNARIAGDSRSGTGGERRRGPVEVLEHMETLPIPIVASVHGVCLGGGLELALASDFIVAAASAKLGSVEATLGLHPLMGAIQRTVQRAGVHRAKEMSMLARRYDPETLERWGLVNLVVADDDLEGATMAVAHELALGPTAAHAATKQLAYIAANEGVRAADLAMSDVQKPIWASEDLKEGLRSFQQDGPGLAEFTGR